MNILTHDGVPMISTSDVRILLWDKALQINDFVIDFPGEYERSLVFVEVRETPSGLIYIITLEGHTALYLTPGLVAPDLSLQDINNKDIVIFPARDTLWKTIETWEANVIVPYGDDRQSFLQKIGQTPPSEETATIKVADFESETVRYILLA